MKRVLLALCFPLVMHAQTRITSDIEIRQMEQVLREASDFGSKVAAHVNLGDLHTDRNEEAAAIRDYESALQLAQDERDAARRSRDFSRYAIACGWSGVALARVGREPEAFRVFEEALRYAGDSRGVWNGYSAAMFRLRLADKAIGAARAAVAAAERAIAGRAAVREELQLNIDRFALATALLDRRGKTDVSEAESVLLSITKSLESDVFESLRRTVGAREEFQVVTAPTTDSGMYLSIFNRAHMRLASMYEEIGQAEKASREYEAVLGRRSDEPRALAGLARISANAADRDRYLILSLDANPFSQEVVAAYERHVASGEASPVTRAASTGSRVRLAIQQMYARDHRRARETLQSLLKTHPDNDLLASLLARVQDEAGDGSTRPWFLVKPPERVADPSEADLHAVLALFASNRLTPEDNAALDQIEFSSDAEVEALEDGTFQSGTFERVPFQFQAAVRFSGVSATEKRLRLAFRILGATTIDGRDGLLVEPLSAEVAE